MDMTVEVPELPELTFDEASHIYRLNGDIIPSVSKLMEPLKDQCYGGISKRTLENAAIKGSAVHNSIENWIKFGIDDIPSEHRGYFNGFMEWWKQYKPRVFGSEVRIYHKLMRYGGTIDLLCEIGGLLELIDFKTTYTLLEMACGVQLEAYAAQKGTTERRPIGVMFDPETGHQQLYDMMMDAPALLLCYQEKRAGEAVGHTIFARSGTRADLNSYITTNREEEAVALAKGKKIKRPQEGKLEPLKCSMLPLDYEITEDSDIRIIQIAGANAQYYRMLWTHNFVGSQATYNRAVLIDGYVAAVFGISKMAADSIFVWYVMKAPHKLYRLGRLCYMLAQNQSFVDTLLDDIDQEKVTKMRTAMLTKYAENKEVRGIMKLVNRQEDAKNGYKLTYEAALVDGRDEKATLAEWLRREKQWQQKRAQQ